MIKKQLNIWKNDFLRYYDKTSLMARILIGAILSALLAFYVSKNIIKMQTSEIKTINGKINSLEVIEDVDATLIDLKNNQRKADKRLEGLKKMNEEIAKRYGTLSRQDTSANILMLRSLIDENNIKIISETLVQKLINARRVVRGKAQIDTRIKILFPANIASDTYKFELLGKFNDIRNFLTTIFNSKTLFFINNVKLENTNETITDENFIRHKAIKCSFEVHVPYGEGKK